MMKYAFNLFYRNIFLNILILLLLAISSINLLFCTIAYVYGNLPLELTKNLRGDGIVHLTNPAGLKDFIENAQIEGIEGGKYCFQDYISSFPFTNSTISSSMNFFYYYDYINAWSPNLISGRIPKPALLSDEYREVLVSTGCYNLGDIINVNKERDGQKWEWKLKVVGTLSQDFCFIQGESAFNVGIIPTIAVDNLYQSEAEAIGKMVYLLGCMEDFEDYIKSSNFNSTSLILKFNKDYFTTNESKIISQLSEFGTAISFDKTYQNTLDGQRDEYVKRIFLFSLFFILSLALILIYIVLLIKKKTHELSAMYICGFSMKKIFSSFIVYFAGITFIALIIAYCFVLFGSPSSNAPIPIMNVTYPPSFYWISAVYLLCFFLCATSIFCITFFRHKTLSKIYEISE